jgi:hypothetical protein
MYKSQRRGEKAVRAAQEMGCDPCCFVFFCMIVPVLLIALCVALL